MSGLKNYRITFTRYRGHERVFSAPMFATAESFGDAYDHALIMLKGMRTADPDGEYDIHSITNDLPVRAQDTADVGFHFTKGKAAL